MPSRFYKHFFSWVSRAGLVGVLVLSPFSFSTFSFSTFSFSTQSGQAGSIGDRDHRLSNQTRYLAQASDVLAILKGLPQPSAITGNIAELFSANAHAQQSLNFQANLKADDVVAFYQEKLTEQGYVEREINRATGAWGFNLVFDPPDSVNLTPTDDSKSVALVLQGTMLGPDTININVRFDEL